MAEAVQRAKVGLASDPDAWQAGLALATEGIVLLDESGRIAVLNNHR